MASFTHKALLSSLTPEARAYLTAKTNIHGCLQLVVHAGLIMVLMVLVAVRAPFWWLFMLPLGVLLVFLFTLLHESIHRTVFKPRAWNDLVALFCGWLLLLPPRWFRYFHFEHHRHTQNPDKDPELISKKPQTFFAYLVYISGLPVTLSMVKTMFRNASGRCADSFVPETARSGIAVESRLMLLSYILITLAVALTGQLDVLVLCWWLPMVIGQPFLRLYLMAEHGRCPFVDDMFANTRTVFTSWLVCRLAWNMPFHAEHHAYPAVPFHRLPEFHQMIRNHLKVTSNGYREFHLETIRSHLK